MTWPRLHKQYTKWKSFLTKDTSIDKLSWSITLSILMGVFPLIGTNNIIIALLAMKFRLNMALMFAISYALYPVQILLLVPYLRIGEQVLGAGATPLSWQDLKVSFGLGILPMVHKFGNALLLSTVGWLLTSLLILSVLNYFFKFILRKTLPVRWAQEQQTSTSPATANGLTSTC
ncbi:DUF2062 domain-containing protein [Telluribacter sp.]|jgi:uncharacterized protein (DUF2062 family)|uniref:DUF2062 domain-containing protein n=1 Tax=Telluribacter sp. TaxID=1978767 RepID=UPI002E14AFEF|nr:DUF2062 domain-containing protein [Telluribacter sp.]